MLEHIKKGTIDITHGVTVIAIYAIVWDIVVSYLKNYSKGERIFILCILMLFMFLTSGRSFEFLQDWGI